MMMDERMRWARKLNNLIKRNFQIARTYKKLIEVIPNDSIKKFLSQKISQVMECANELEQEVDYLELDNTIMRKSISYSEFKFRSLNLLGPNASLLLRYCIKQEKSNINFYKKALTRINEGAIREKLMRHISLFEIDLKELKLLESRLNSRKSRNNTLLSS